MGNAFNTLRNKKQMLYSEHNLSFLGFFLVVLWFELRPPIWYALVIFLGRILHLCPGWPHTTILTSTSGVPEIIGMSRHGHLQLA
jgi:hypothetical protein